MTVKQIEMIPYEVILAQEKIWFWERAGIMKKIYLMIRHKKPKSNEYELCRYYPMSEDFYKVFPHHKF